MAHGSSQYRTRRLPKRSKTIPLYGDPYQGDGIDSGKYFRCWNCGQICDVTRDALGGDESGSGEAYTDFYSPGYPGVDSDPLTSVITVRKNTNLGIHAVLMEKGSDGNAKAIVHELKVNSSTGCPTCHSLNWRGDY